MIFKERYKSKGRIGKGGYGEVWKVLDKKDGESYAIKLIAKDVGQNVDDFIKDCEKEIKPMQKIKSKYIIKLKDSFYDESYEGYCIVMELCDSDLRKILEKYKPKGLPLNLINKIFLQLNDVLKEMSKIEFVHRDLKPENILIKYKNKEKKFLILN